VPGLVVVIAVRAAASDVVVLAAESDAAAFASVQVRAAASDVAEQVWVPAALFAAPEAAGAEPDSNYGAALPALHFAAGEPAFQFVGSAPASVSFPGWTALQVSD